MLCESQPLFARVIVLTEVCPVGRSCLSGCPECWASGGDAELPMEFLITATTGKDLTLPRPRFYHLTKVLAGKIARRRAWFLTDLCKELGQWPGEVKVLSVLPLQSLHWLRAQAKLFFLLFNSTRRTDQQQLVRSLNCRQLLWLIGSDRWEVVSWTGSKVRETSASLVHVGMWRSRQLQKSWWWRCDEPGVFGFFFLWTSFSSECFLPASPRIKKAKRIGGAALDFLFWASSHWNPLRKFNCCK